jgi:hypothetical protein
LNSREYCFEIGNKSREKKIEKLKKKVGKCQRNYSNQNGIE